MSNKFIFPESFFGGSFFTEELSPLFESLFLGLNVLGTSSEREESEEAGGFGGAEGFFGVEVSPL